ncbi:hypothetical protein FRX31_009706 [Thalictrum thalictroides]|uniref:Uncharacterized protein n=1 Tax=Thalictrum thalictroides TaxID=46969 RepID=A0A7J6WUJ1_THATH|nr:hypothetical protein FRX31_009706 [Thalictrum thalictroides]
MIFDDEFGFFAFTSKGVSTGLGSQKFGGLVGFNSHGIAADLWATLPYAVFWIVWRTKNEIVFDGGSAEAGKAYGSMVLMFIREVATEIWAGLPHAVIWCTWRTRNEEIFNNGMAETGKVVQNIEATSWAWLTMSERAIERAMELCKRQHLLIG